MHDLKFILDTEHFQTRKFFKSANIMLFKKIGLTGLYVQYFLNMSDYFDLRGFVADFNRFLNSQNIYLCCIKLKNNGPFLLHFAILEH